MTDLSVVASRLSRAADKLEKLAAQATPGPWSFYNGDLWIGSSEALAAYDADPENVEWPYDDLGPRSGHLFLGDPEQPADAEFIAAFDPRTVAALVPLLRRVARKAERLAEPGRTPFEQVLVELAEWDTFAARLLHEEETGG